MNYELVRPQERNNFAFNLTKKWLNFGCNGAIISLFFHVGAHLVAFNFIIINRSMNSWHCQLGKVSIVTIEWMHGYDEIFSSLLVLGYIWLLAV